MYGRAYFSIVIHYGKSTCMTLGSRYKIQNAGKLKITIGDTPINSVSSQKTFRAIH